VIAVGAGKGGVGKSTIAVNLAVALARMGASTGLLDGDIYGPSAPTMLGLEDEPTQARGNMLLPFEVHGIKAMTIGKLVDPDKPLIWRGPMAHGAFKQLATQTEWGELDYLIVDLPPGTSDAQLTLAQAVPIAGCVLVTTPQDVALSDVTKALAMFRRMNVPILGIVENMSAFACPHCGELTEIFGRGGAERLAKEEGLDNLGRIPLEMAVRQGGDAGIPAVAQREEGPAAAALKELAGQVAARLAVRAANETAPTLTVA
jgi:ATP-binding protein involved in chromosome partitioning